MEKTIKILIACLLFQIIGLMISCICKNPDIHWYKWKSINANFINKDKLNTISNSIDKNSFAIHIQITNEKTSNNFKLPNFFIQNSYAFIDCDKYSYYIDTLKDVKITTNIPYNSNYNISDNLKKEFKITVYTTTGYYEKIEIDDFINFTQKYSGK
jgi:hypothetical protein